jgi:hypothetical protein
MFSQTTGRGAPDLRPSKVSYSAAYRIDAKPAV